MANGSLFARNADQNDDGPPEGAPLAGSRSEAIQRLQIGVTGLFAMVLVMGVASAISNRAQVSEDKAVPGAAPTTEPSATPSQVNPLADAGVVPDVPVEAETQVEAEAEDQAAGEEGTTETSTVPDIEPTDGAARSNAPARD